MRFVGRERELALLRRRWDESRRGQAALIAMRGRRRVGKSRLVEEFAHGTGAPYVFYTAVQEASDNELERFNEAVAASGLPNASLLAGRTWEAALTILAQQATLEQPLIIVMDELPYLKKKEPSIEAIIQKVWDSTAQRRPILWLLIGSDEAMMEALTEQGRPLYDRAREMVVYPLTPADVSDMLDLEPADTFDAYTIIGGFPVLAQEWGRGRTAREYLAEALTDPTSFLVISAERALAAEFPDSARARSVLTAIGAGARTHKDISRDTGLSSTVLDQAFDILLEKRVVERLTPYSTKASPKNRRWAVRDPYMRFWLRFAEGRIDLIERGRGELLLQDFDRLWESYRGQAIEPIVRDSIERLLPDPEFDAARYVGSYWTRNNLVEVDLVGGDRAPVAREVSFIGSIKWRKQRSFSGDDAVALANHRTSVPGAAQAKLLGVSAQGFDDDAQLDIPLAPDQLLAAWRSPPDLYQRLG